MPAETIRPPGAMVKWCNWLSGRRVAERERARHPVRNRPGAVMPEEPVLDEPIQRPAGPDPREGLSGPHDPRNSYNGPAAMTADEAVAGGESPDAVLHAIVEGTAAETGEAFFTALVRNLSGALGRAGAWVTEDLPDPRRLRALAFWPDGRPALHYEYALAGTPCEPVMDGRRLVHIPDRVVELYPSDPDLKTAGAVSSMGIPLEDLDGTLLGHLAVLDRRPLPSSARTEAVFRIFAARAAAELRRLRADAEIRARQQKLRGLVEGTLDAIVELDRELRVMLANPAAAAVFGCSLEEMTGTDFTRFLVSDTAETLRPRAREAGDRRSVSITGLRARTASGAIFPAEATLSLVAPSLILNPAQPERARRGRMPPPGDPRARRRTPGRLLPQDRVRPIGAADRNCFQSGRSSGPASLWRPPRALFAASHGFLPPRRRAGYAGTLTLGVNSSCVPQGVGRSAAMVAIVPHPPAASLFR